MEEEAKKEEIQQDKKEEIKVEAKSGEGEASGKTSISQELKRFNGTPGLCKRVSNLEIIVRRIMYSLCFIGGTGGIIAGINKLIGG